MPRILVVDDDAMTLRGFVRGLRGFQVLLATDVEGALHHARSVRVDVAIVDLYLGNESGIDLVRLLRAERPDHDELAIVLITALYCANIGIGDPRK